MKTIAQRTLRNESGKILRQTEEGQRFVITVQGRPVALLAPYERRQWVPADTVRDLLATPTDPGLLDDLRGGPPDPMVDPWEQ